MCEVVKVLERELNNAGLIYIYLEEDSKWYVYERSAYLLSRLMTGISLERHIMGEALWLARAEVDIKNIPSDSIISYTKKEYVLSYTHQNVSQDWLADIENTVWGI